MVMPVNPLSDQEINTGLARLDGGLGKWSVLEGKLHREYEFRNFKDAFGFMTEVAEGAERLDHHPDWSNSWNQVVVDIVDHSAGGITETCFRLAEVCEGAAKNY